MAAVSATSKRQWLAYVLCGLFLVLAAMWFYTRIATAQGISYDPYADAVADSTPVVTDANNAVGAPNGTNASLVGPGATLTLDMGAGEEGTQTLRLYLGQVNAQVNIDVTFLDKNKAIISSENRQLGVDINPSTQNFGYNWTNFGKTYRYVRISSVAGGGVNVDAVEALGYIGSSASQDTDGDGRTDRTEQDAGTDTLVPNPTSASGGSATNTNGSKKTATTTKRPIPGTANGNGVSAQTNAPPAINHDQDSDGMADDWERNHGLDPNNAKDARDDPDYDELRNLVEYKINSDPQKMDTDGDGMPDRWEHDHGLDVTKNDADGDPDGDFLTNLGEYRHDTDPNKADDLYKVFSRDCTVDGWEWLVLVLLLAGATSCWLMASKVGQSKTSSKSKGKKR